MPEMVEVVVDSVRVSLMSAQRMVILRQVSETRFLPVWVGPYEAEAISVALQEVEMARPLTHDLLKSLFPLLNARVLRVEIPELKEDVFFGRIVVEHAGGQLNVDSRPSDAIALAVRVHVPILVSLAVMDAAGIVPEADIQSQVVTSLEDEPQPEDDLAADESRLDVFDDFLRKLDHDTGAPESPESPNP